MTVFSQRLRELRLNRDMSQRDLARCIGVTPTSIQRFEYGTGKPALDTVISIADFFKVSVDYLIGRVDSPHFEKSSESTGIDEAVIEQLRQAGYAAIDKKICELFPKLQNVKST